MVYIYINILLLFYIITFNIFYNKYYIKLLQVSSNSSENIKNILNSFTDGGIIENYYDIFKNLNNSMRNNLASVIIKHKIQKDLHNTKITTQKFLNLAKDKNDYIPIIFYNLKLYYDLFFLYKVFFSQILCFIGIIYFLVAQ